MRALHTIAITCGAALVTASLGASISRAAEASGAAPEAHSYEATEVITDAWLDGKLEASLLFNEDLNPFDIDTEVRQGVAYLTGAVESGIDKDLAGQIARSIDGVNSVENNLVVDKAQAAEGSNSTEGKERATFKQNVLNATLTARVKSQLLLNSDTSGLAIEVDTTDGVVRLSGTVASEQQREQAAEIARSTDGTRSVKNELVVEA
jgi:osmotically-inducible protein OsmY